MNFRVGQMVVYVGTDEDYPREPRKIVAIRQSCCYVEIDTGVPLPKGCVCTYCNICGKDSDDDSYWKVNYLFRPLEDNFAEEVLSKALQEGIELAKEIEA